MKDYPRLRIMLAVSFDSEARMSLDVAKDLYARFAPEHPELPALREELRDAMHDPDVSWCDLLRAAKYPQLNLSSEERARTFVDEVIAGPILAGS